MHLGQTNQLLIKRGTVGDCEGEMIEAGAGGIELVTAALDWLVNVIMLLVITALSSPMALQHCRDPGPMPRSRRAWLDIP